MDWIIWLVVIVVIVAIVWWLLNRNSSRRSSGSAGPGTAVTPDSATPHLHDVDNDATHRGALSDGGSGPSASAAGLASTPTAAGFHQAEPETEPEPAPDAAAAAEPSTEAAAVAAPAGAGPEWETQWSETPPAEPHAELHQQPGASSRGDQTMGATAAGAATGAPVHHREYTEPHAPTLPGAESAAAETETEAGVDAQDEAGRTAAPATHPAQAPAEATTAEAETRQTAMSAAASETAAGHTAEPAGHLAVDQPYGEGSAAPAPDGSGPEGFTVKGNASSMVYHDETSPAFESTRAEVWFLSAAHAEAAGFRPPRRTRQ
ncbi:hypothetical protein [Pseudarthrobacter sp. PvP090]|uniref:sunset domain-containing protein n=1 Tax=Pseudarthrobacter sp. PvP090 TaxID=3156393 RepID=UPI003398B09F